jgi:hypothetical protein
MKPHQQEKANAFLCAPLLPWVFIEKIRMTKTCQ